MELTPREAALAEFGGRLRVRVCGVALKDNRVLLIAHTALLEEGLFWGLPGGSVDFGESLEAALKREFLEETNLVIKVGKFLGFNEFLRPPLHAIEFFYEVEVLSGEAILGRDPELEAPIMVELAWMTKQEIVALPAMSVHPKLLELLTTSQLSLG